MSSENTMRLRRVKNLEHEISPNKTIKEVYGVRIYKLPAGFDLKEAEEHLDFMDFLALQVTPMDCLNNNDEAFWYGIQACDAPCAEGGDYPKKDFLDDVIINWIKYCEDNDSFYIQVRDGEKFIGTFKFISKEVILPRKA